MTHLRSRVLLPAAALALLSACGGGSSTSPGGGGTAIVVKDGGTGGASGATVTMTDDGGVSPATVTVSVGQTVTFVNNGPSKSHEIASNPHPQHGSCPSIEALGVLAPGQTRQTHNFGNAGTCGYHDHQDDTNVKFQGTIIVQ